MVQGAPLVPHRGTMPAGRGHLSLRRLFESEPWNHPGADGEEMGFLKDLLRYELLRACLKSGFTWTAPRDYTKLHSTDNIAPISGTGLGARD